MSSSSIEAPVLQDLTEPLNSYIHNPVAGKIVDKLITTRVTPNQITYCSVMSGLASAYIYSLGNTSLFFFAGLLLEVSLILDCVDGQLARARNSISEWGRLIDGIGGYIANLAVVFGIMAGVKSQSGALIMIAVITILKAITYDYSKLIFTSICRHGYDGNRKEIVETFNKFLESPSILIKVYYYYLQVQQWIFRGQWETLQEIKSSPPQLTEINNDHRSRFYETNKNLILLWRWNGSDLVLFCLVLFSIFGILEQCLSPLAWVIGLQLAGTLLFHRKFFKDARSS